MACILCGGNSGKYHFCLKCNKLKDEGKVIKCSKCGQWHYLDVNCKCETENVRETINSDNKCIVCGENAPNGHLCRDCYYEMRDFKESFDKNSKVFDMKDYYFNLRSNIYRMKTFDYIKSNCNKLMAIANFVVETYKDTSLVDRIVNDIKEIIDAVNQAEKPTKEESI